MIDSVAHQLAENLKSIPFLDVVGGIARQQKIRVGDREKTLPAYPDMAKKDGYFWLTPDSKHSGIAFFETSNNRAIGELSGGRGIHFAANLRVIVWLNLRRIAPADVGAMKQQVVYALNGSFAFNNAVLSVTSEVPRTPAIFSAYTFDETETQYLMLPYDYFAFDFECRYTVNHVCQTVNVVKSDPDAC